jgi:hypothetical protein
METYNLNAINKEKENNTIKQILCNNKYISILNKSTTTEHKVKQNTSKTKWAKYTYVGKDNTIRKLLSKKQKHIRLNLTNTEYTS